MSDTVTMTTTDEGLQAIRHALRMALHNANIEHLKAEQIYDKNLMTLWEDQIDLIEQTIVDVS